MNPNTLNTSPESPQIETKKPRRSRISAVLLIIAVLITLPTFMTPHAILRLPLAIVTIVDLWKTRKWAFTLLWVTGAIWLLVFFTLAMFLLIAPPWELWLQWLYWLIPTSLVVTACVLMTTAAGKAELAKWSN